jgi:PASTA domain-containing protein
MALRPVLPRLVVLGAVFLFAGATLTYGAAQRLSAGSGPKPTPPASAPTVVVPDVTGQAFVFAKGALEDAGFAWHVVGSVHGYAVNSVVTQTPAAGTKLKDTGAPTITLSLARSSYPETGEPEDLSPYIGTAVVPAATPFAARRAAHAPAAAKKPAVAPRVVRPKPAATAKPAVKPKPAAKPKAPAARPPAFVVRGAPKEPLKEMPLTARARLLSAWLSAHPKPTNATVRHFLYQNAWIVTGARFGWWHGAQALRLLIAADRKAQRVWGIGHRSELAARHALAEVEARSR